MLGGGNTKKLKKLPKGSRRGDNDNAFIGGFRLWDDVAASKPDVVPSGVALNGQADAHQAA